MIERACSFFLFTFGFWTKEMLELFSTQPQILKVQKQLPMSKDLTTNWSKAEFKAYLLLFCANADFIESEEEKEFIKSKIDTETYNRIHKEFDADNDYQGIQKIMWTAKKHDYSKEQIDVLMEDIKVLFLSDGEYDTLERNLMIGLKRLL